MKGFSALKSLVVGMVVVATAVLANSGAAYASANNCVDGSVASNLVITNWSPTNGTAHVATLNNAPLCNDVTLYFSTYIIPATYDRSGTFDVSATPQSKYDASSVVLAAGTSGNADLTVKVPDRCNNYQIDLYYAPEITTVTYTGNSGSRVIKAAILNSTLPTCTINTTTTVTPTNTTTTTSTPQTTVSQPTLADTGQNPLLPATIALLTAVAATITTFPFMGRLKKIAVKA